MYARTINEIEQSRRGIAEGMVLALAGLTIRLPDGSRRRFEGAAAGPEGEIEVRDPRVFRRLLSGGDLGLAESYMDGEWESPDLAAVIALGAANDAVLARTLAGTAWARLAGRLVHKLRPNSKRGSRRNIAAHYDLGNDFYGAWLDPSMTYSAGLFASASDDDLAAAQDRKYRRIAALADIARGHHVLEIGCGWGGFCTWAAREIGCRVTAITISREQYDFTRARVRAEGLEDKVDVRLQDYRDLSGSYDAIVSIEMLEAVGEAYWPVYFRQLRARLRPGGKATGDQKRVVTPRQARDDGASVLVIGRPISRADDPLQAAREIEATL